MNVNGDLNWQNEKGNHFPKDQEIDMKLINLQQRCFRDPNRIHKINLYGLRLYSIF